MRKICLIAGAALCLTLCGCGKREYTQSLFAMDTVMNFTIYAENDAALSDVKTEIERMDALLDRGNENGEIYAVNKNKTAEVSAETADLIRAAVEISEKTDGAFDISMAAVSDLWGFYGGNFRVPADSELQTALSGAGYEKIRLDGNKITIPQNAAIDLGGIGKGCASDRAADILKNSGVKSAVMSLGGNVYTLGKRPDGEEWKIGIADPRDTSSVIGTVKVSDTAVVTSGGYQRFFESGGRTYHHIIDPATGKSAESGLSSVTIVSKSSTSADGLSTALFVKGLEDSVRLWRENGEFEAVFVTSDGGIFITEGLSDTFETERGYEIIKRGI